MKTTEVKKSALDLQIEIEFNFKNMSEKEMRKLFQIYAKQLKLK